VHAAQLAIIGIGQEEVQALTLAHVRRAISTHVNAMKDSVDKMNVEIEKANKLDAEKQAEAFCHKIKPLMDTVRENADRLEMMIDDEMWPLPKMREILFTR
jgi:glutamine synthetase